MLKDFTKEQYDIIIQAGQSNSQGCGFGAIEKPFEVNDRIWQMNQDFTISPAQEVVWGNNAICQFALPFAARYVAEGRLAEGRKLLVIRAAVGGTGFLDKHWGMTDDLYLQMMEMTKTVLCLNAGNRLVAFLWHQGETDASLKATCEGHYNRLMTLVKSVTSTFDCEKLPFIAGDFVQHWKGLNLAICEPVIEAMRGVCRDLPKGAFVETDGLLSNDQTSGGEDTIHFSRQALMELGDRYFEKYALLV